MAFLVKNFSPIGANAKRGVVPQHFSYKTADTFATVDTTGYFNSISSQLEVGDVITAALVDSVTVTTAVSSYGTFIVSSNAAGIVDVYNAGNVFTPTDSD